MFEVLFSSQVSKKEKSEQRELSIAPSESTHFRVILSSEAMEVDPEDPPSGCSSSCAPCGLIKPQPRAPRPEPSGGPSAGLRAKGPKWKSSPPSRSSSNNNNVATVTGHTGGRDAAGSGLEPEPGGRTSDPQGKRRGTLALALTLVLMVMLTLGLRLMLTLAVTYTTSSLYCSVVIRCALRFHHRKEVMMFTNVRKEEVQFVEMFQRHGGEIRRSDPESAVSLHTGAGPPHAHS